MSVSCCNCNLGKEDAFDTENQWCSFEKLLLNNVELIEE